MKLLLVSPSILCVQTSTCTCPRDMDVGVVAFILGDCPDAVDECQRPGEIRKRERLRQVMLPLHGSAVELRKQLFGFAAAQGGDTPAARDTFLQG